MEFEMVEKLTVSELKNFLRLRDLKLTGKKAELVARVFAAIENKVPVKKTATEVESQLRDEYQAKLLLNDILIPDPNHLASGWLTEDDGICLWPVVLYADIFNFLMFKPNDLCSTDLNDYKQSKAYSYFQCGWLNEISYHPISLSSPYCLLKAKCRPSERINEPPHKCWVSITKKNGNIKSAHCDCMAGMPETCNHVAALLFRLEAAVRLGLTNPSCTTKSCEWLPNRKEVKPLKAKDMNLSRDDFRKREKKRNNCNSSTKKIFNPIEVNIKPLKLVDIAAALEEIIPDSTLFTGVPKPEIDFVREVITQKPAKPDVIGIYDIILKSDSLSSFQNNISKHMTKENIMFIESLTRGQSNNECWYFFRRGVVTASKGHDVKTKMETLKRVGSCSNMNLWNLFQKISGLVFVRPDIEALKYGVAMEPNAVNCFREVISKKHTNLQLEECGLFLHHEFPVIGASPDRIVTCACCSKACLEVKCPISINYTSPLDLNIDLPYLERSGENVSLKKNHRYHTQCQMQMGVTGLKTCYFFVWTPHGFFLETVEFDVEFWHYLQEKISDFYVHYLKNNLV